LALRQRREVQEESSFFGKKEAKKLCPFAAGYPNSRFRVRKVFLLLFFQKKKTLPPCHLPSRPRLAEPDAGQSPTRCAALSNGGAFPI
jgi:hypothetical protein